MKIAIIAHDGKKAEMVAFLLENKPLKPNVSGSYRYNWPTC